MSRLSIRLRLTIWYGAVLAAVLVLFGGAVYLLMGQELLARIDAALEGEFLEIVDDVEAIPDRDKLERQLSRRLARHGGYEFQVVGKSWEAPVRSDRLRERGLPVPTIPASLMRLDFETAPLGARSLALGPLGRWRVASRLLPGADGPVVAQVAAPLAAVDHELAELLTVLLLAGPLALAAALGGGYLLARKALAPVDRMAAVADQITATRLDRRLDVPNPDDELGRLDRTLNGMIARLERSFDEVRRFTADAAHELRTPLAVLRSAAEYSIRAPRSAEQYVRAQEDQLEEIDRLTRLVEGLLFLSRGDAGHGAPAFQTVHLDHVIRDVADDMQPIAGKKGLTLATGDLTACPVRGDESQLRRLFFNVLDNATKYTPPGGAVTIQSESRDGEIHVVVADTGVGIPAEHLPRVFDRFYRIDPAPGVDSEGSGLGLAITRAIAEGHGGTVRIDSTPGHGTRVTLRLPAAE
jgi:heavy metal sensor kinase